MQYALLMYQDQAFEERWAAAGAEERAELFAEFDAFVRGAEALGATILGGNELGLSHTATTLRRTADDVVVTDGPFAEVAEHLGGYFVIEARDLDQAIEVARLLPVGTTEIRPVMGQPEGP